ncbi:hypothetical protein KR093_003313, partial [Drosophila rubida]
HNDINVVLNGPVQSITRMRTRKEQRTEVDWVSKLQHETLYIAHGNWIDFAAHGKRKPIYISMVRDPVERMIHNYYDQRTLNKMVISRSIYAGYPQKTDAWYKQSFEECVRSGSPECRYIQYSVVDAVEDFKRQSLFFCGHNDDCLPFNTPRAVQMAKRRVELEYAVVGTWDHPNITLTVLEKYVPRYFNHARKLYSRRCPFVLSRHSFPRLHRHAVDADVRALVRRNFTHEYDFYYFCKQRLYKQYIALQLEHNLN